MPGERISGVLDTTVKLQITNTEKRPSCANQLSDARFLPELLSTLNTIFFPKNPYYIRFLCLRKCVLSVVWAGWRAWCAAGAMLVPLLVKTGVWRHFVSILGFFVLLLLFAPLAPALASSPEPAPAKSRRKNGLPPCLRIDSGSLAHQWEAPFFVRHGDQGRDRTNKDIFLSAWVGLGGVREVAVFKDQLKRWTFSIYWYLK